MLEAGFSPLFSRKCQNLRAVAVLKAKFARLIRGLFRYCSGDPATTLTSPIGQPVAQIFYDNIGQAGGVFFTVAAFIILNFTGITAIQAGARTVWAFSRDEMLPLSRVWYIINGKTRTPIYAVW